MPLPIRILTVVPEEILRAGIRAIIESAEGLQIIGEAENESAGLRLFRKLQPDVAIVALRFGQACALDLIPEFVNGSGNSRIIVLAGHSGDAEISKALKLGAAGFICYDTSADELTAALRSVAAGRHFITDRVAQRLGESIGKEQLTRTETNILGMLVGGMSNKEIAFALDISENTVKSHLKNIFNKLGVSDRVTAVTTAIRRGLVRVDL